MGQMNHLGSALQYIATARNQAMRAISDATGVAPSTLSRVIQGVRLEPQNLRALCTRLPVPADGLDILIAHLRDEIDRAGRLQTEIRIDADTHDHEEDIRLLARECQRDRELAAILHDLATLVRRHRRDDARQHSHAAEDLTPYPSPE